MLPRSLPSHRANQRTASCLFCRQSRLGLPVGPPADVGNDFLSSGGTALFESPADGGFVAEEAFDVEAAGFPDELLPQGAGDFEDGSVGGFQFRVLRELAAGVGLDVDPGGGHDFRGGLRGAWQEGDEAEAGLFFPVSVEHGFADVDEGDAAEEVFGETFGVFGGAGAVEFVGIHHDGDAEEPAGGGGQ